MARHGVDEETVKHAAHKLLSQGISPSVQKVREILGTGSNTTIAQHLKIWREEYATKQVHYLPANMPKELAATFEILWQTALEHAAKQLEHVKANLLTEQEALVLTKKATEQQLNALQTERIQTLDSMEQKTQQLQTLQTNLAVKEERLQQKEEEIILLKAQYETRLQRTQDETYQAIEQITASEKKLEQLKQEMIEQHTNHQTLIQEERTRQEGSEVRWLRLIDQAREDNRQLKKTHHKALNTINNKVNGLQSKWSEAVNQLTVKQSLLNDREKIIETLTKQNTQLQSLYNKAQKDLTIFELKLKKTPKHKKKTKQLEQS